MIEKAKSKLNLGVKECLVCGEEFQPASGAQKACSPECKAKAKAQGLTKRGLKNRGGVDDALKAPKSSFDRVQERFQPSPPAAAETFKSLLSW